jgi:hypothetical protein
MAKEVFAAKKRRRLQLHEPNVGQPSQSSILEPGLMVLDPGPDSDLTEQADLEARTFNS